MPGLRDCTFRDLPPPVLYELVYNSVSVPIDMGQDKLARILAGARRRNRELGITGLLLYHQGEFLQLLEGEKQAVLDLYHRIIAPDARHRHASVCWEDPIKQRGFADWSMGFSSAQDLDPPPPGMEGYLDGGLAALDLSGPASTGRKALLAIYDLMRARP